MAKKRKKKRKYIDEQQFKHFFSKDATPVKLERNAIPDIFSRFAKKKKLMSLQVVSKIILLALMIQNITE